MSHVSSLLTAAALLSLVGRAHAQEQATDLVSAPGQPAAGQLWLGLALELDFSQRRSGSLAVAPDLAVGVGDDTTLAWTHSSASIARFGQVGGLCVRRCDYRPDYASALVLRQRVLHGHAGELAALAGGMLRDLDPAKPAALAGGAGRWHSGRWGVELTGYLQLGLAHRDEGNRDRLVLELQAMVQPTCRWSLGVVSGAQGELSVFRDGYHTPLMLQVAARITEHLVLTMRAGFPSLLGPQNTGSVRGGSLALELQR